ncbi:MAG: Mov34/MPN/PAD-1 family protein [Candidatus Freyrarchaeum guaymaensis]
MVPLTIPRIRKIILRKEHLRTMLEETRRVYPMEACGVILGRFEADVAKALEVIPTKNVAESSVRFIIDPEKLYKILVRAENEGREMVGIFHSHPSVSKPSGVDKPFMKLNPVVWIILSTLNKKIDIDAYQWFENEIHPVEMVIED